MPKLRSRPHDDFAGWAGKDGAEYFGAEFSGEGVLNFGGGGEATGNRFFSSSPFYSRVAKIFPLVYRC